MIPSKTAVIGWQDGRKRSDHSRNYETSWLRCTIESQQSRQRNVPQKERNGSRTGHGTTISNRLEFAWSRAFDGSKTQPHKRYNKKKYDDKNKNNDIRASKITLYRAIRLENTAIPHFLRVASSMKTQAQNTTYLLDESEISSYSRNRNRSDRFVQRDQRSKAVRRSSTMLLTGSLTSWRTTKSLVSSWSYKDTISTK